MKMIRLPRFSAGDAERAYEEWGCNCGPAAVAAICRLTLFGVRPHMGDFESKGYTNPTLMWRVLDSIGVQWRLVKLPRTWPEYGLARIQWEGPWTEPGALPRWAYRHTHWVGAATDPVKGIGIFDINAMSNGSGWVALEDWTASLVPWIIEECVPRANGGWPLTHVVEVARP
jgi:hypothetical protein